MGPVPDPALFVIDFQKKKKSNLFCLLLFEGTFTSFFKDQNIKKSQNIRNNFAWWWKDPDPDLEHWILTNWIWEEEDAGIGVKCLCQYIHCTYMYVWERYSSDNYKNQSGKGRHLFTTSQFLQRYAPICSLHPSFWAHKHANPRQLEIDLESIHGRKISVRGEIRDLIKQH